MNSEDIKTIDLENKTTREVSFSDNPDTLKNSKIVAPSLDALRKLIEIPSIDELERMILEKIYPMGSVYISQSDKRDPNEILGFGTWKQIVDRYIYANSKPEEGGSEYITKEMIPSHTHPIDTYTNTDAGSHTHDITVHHRYNVYQASGGSVWVVNNNETGGQDETNWTVSNPGNHRHRIQSNTQDSTAATQKNLPAYMSFYIWYRTD